MLSIPHMIVVFVIVLVVFGPQKLPELARGLGKMMAEFRKASTDFKSAFEEEMRDLERQAREVERRKAEAASAATPAQTQPAMLAAPSSDETQEGGGESAAAGATEGSIAETGGSEGPVVAPVAEGNIARGTETDGLAREHHSVEHPTSAEQADRQDVQAKVQKADS